MRALLVALLVLPLLLPPASAEIVERTVMLLPSADDVPAQWTRSGCAVGQEYDCVNDNPPHDVDATYITANPNPGQTVVSAWQIGNLPAEVRSVVNVSMFTWVRLESGDPSGFSARILLQDDTACTTIVPAGLVTTYRNASFVYDLDCAGNAWTADNVNGLRREVFCADDALGPSEANCRITAAGLVVTYTASTGSLTPSEWTARIGLILFVLFFLVGIFGRSPLFLMFSGLVLVFLAFSMFAVSERQEWLLGLGLIFGPGLVVMGGVMLAAGEGE